MMEYRSAMFMASDVDRCIEESAVRAQKFHSEEEFWELLASEVALKVREARKRDAEKNDEEEEE